MKNSIVIAQTCKLYRQGVDIKSIVERRFKSYNLQINEKEEKYFKTLIRRDTEKIITQCANCHGSTICKNPTILKFENYGGKRNIVAPAWTPCAKARYSDEFVNAYKMKTNLEKLLSR